MVSFPRPPADEMQPVLLDGIYIDAKSNHNSCGYRGCPFNALAAALRINENVWDSGLSPNRNTERYCADTNFTLIRPMWSSVMWPLSSSCWASIFSAA